MLAMGFHADIIDMALKKSTNQMDAAVEELLRLQADGSYDGVLSNLMTAAAAVSSSLGLANGPSTSASATHDIEKESEVRLIGSKIITEMLIH